MRWLLLAVCLTALYAQTTVHLGGTNHGHDLVISDEDAKALMSGQDLRFLTSTDNGHKHHIQITWAGCGEFVVTMIDSHPHWVLPEEAEQEDGHYPFNFSFPDVILNFTMIDDGEGDVAEHSHSYTLHQAAARGGVITTPTLYTTSSATPMDGVAHVHKFNAMYIGCNMFMVYNQDMGSAGAHHDHYWTLWRGNGDMMGKGAKGQAGKGDMMMMDMEVRLAQLVAAWTGGSTNMEAPLTIAPHGHSFDVTAFEMARLASGDSVDTWSTTFPVPGPSEPPMPSDGPMPMDGPTLPPMMPPPMPTMPEDGPMPPMPSDDAMPPKGAKGQMPNPPAPIDPHNHGVRVMMAGCGEFVLRWETSGEADAMHAHLVPMDNGNGKGKAAPPPMDMNNMDWWMENAWTGSYSDAQFADVDLTYGGEAIKTTHDHFFNITRWQDASLRAGQTIRVGTSEGAHHVHWLDLSYVGCDKFSYSITYDPAAGHKHIFMVERVPEDDMPPPPKGAKDEAKKQMAMGVGIGVGGGIVALGAAAVLIKRSRRVKRNDTAEPQPSVTISI